jgi:hypothetical protein
MGMVYEPYLALTPHEDIFARRLVAGDYFAEAAYASERGLSWMLTVVGDPLYRPFLETEDDALAQISPDHDTAHADWLRLQKVQRGVALGVIPPDPARIEGEIEVPGAGPVAIEGLGDLLLGLKSPNAAVEAERVYRKAAVAEIEPIDRIRLALKLANYYSTHGESAHAQAELDNASACRTRWCRPRFPRSTRRRPTPHHPRTRCLNSPSSPNCPSRCLRRKG